MQCKHGVKNGCMACRPCQCGCLLEKHFIRYDHNEGQPLLPPHYNPVTYTGCTVHADCGGYHPNEVKAQ